MSETPLLERHATGIEDGGIVFAASPGPSGIAADGSGLNAVAWPCMSAGPLRRRRPWVVPNPLAGPDLAAFLRAAVAPVRPLACERRGVWERVFHIAGCRERPGRADETASLTAGQRRLPASPEDARYESESAVRAAAGRGRGASMSSREERRKVAL